MQGNFKPGWYEHPTHGLIRVSMNTSMGWTYRCYTQNGDRPLSKERPLDHWIWALSEAALDVGNEPT